MAHRKGIRLQTVCDRYPPRVESDIDVLADMFTACVEGGIILAKASGDNQALIEQVQNYRTHLRLLFAETD